MTNDRRKFMQLASTFTAGSLLLPSIGCNSSPETVTKAAAEAVKTMVSPSLKEFAIQLWTLRDVFPNAPKETLKQLADYGYKQIEGFDGDKGLWWDMGHKDFKKYISDLGIDMPAAHCNIKENFEEKAAQAAEIGMKYLVCPYIGPQTSMDAWKGVTDLFNKCGDICKKNGIRFAYHNHDYSFKAFSGMIPHDYIMENTNPDTVDHEMDIYWVVTGGADPIEYLKKYPNRFRLCHVKDRMKDTDDKQASCTLGTGTIDFPSILKVAKDNGMKYFIAEQERYDGTTPMECAKDNADYLSKLLFT